MLIMLTYNLSNLIGKKFSRLKIIKAYRGQKSRIFCDCVCQCGKEKKRIAFYRIKSGETVSCGCFRKEQATKACFKHGLSKSRLYKVWQNIKQRCSNPDNPSYKWYGAKGIALCKMWQESFKAFYDYIIHNLGERQSAKYSIDRIKNFQGYEPGNIRWATQSEQRSNTSACRYHYIKGERLMQAQVCRRFGISNATLTARLKRMPIEQAVALPSYFRHRRDKK